MKRSLHLFMLRGGVFICIVTLLLTSCENFLKAGEIKEQIEESIEIANSNPILYHIIADKDSGTVSPSQVILKKKGTVNLLFTPADGWSFICWEALDRTTGEPVPDAIKFENPQKLETKATILNPRQNLMIHPKCNLVPKVIDISPRFDNAGCDQDRTIEITFNKALDIQTFDFSAISITTPEGTELFSTDPDASFFGTPYFSDDNKVLNIPTIKGKFLLLPDGADEDTTPHNSKKSTDDITIRIDFTSVKDIDGLSIEEFAPYTYRVNKNVDNVSPVITDIHLYSTSDTSDYFYKELTNKPFYKENGTTFNWSSAKTTKTDGTTEFQNGDYSQNHVSQLYITLKGYDERSGLKGVKIRETYKKDTSGNDIIGSNPKVSELYTSANGEFEIDYPFNSDFSNDGLYLIEVIVLDKADQETKLDYWIIKDTICQLTLGSKETEISNSQGATFINKYLPVYNSETGEYSSKLNFTKFTLNTDGYYDTKKSYRILTAEFRYKGENSSQTIITNQGIETEKNLPTTVTNSIKNFTYNPEKTGYLKLKIQDEAGNSDELEITIPKFATIYKVVDKNEIISDAVDGFRDSKNFVVNYYYTYQESINSPQSDIKKVDNVSTFEENGIYTFYAQQNIYIVYTDPSFRVPLEIFSSFGPAYKYSKEQSSQTVVFPDFELPDNNEITYEKNTAMAKFSINVTLPDDDKVYRIVMKNRNYGQFYTFDNPNEIEVYNGTKYDVWIIASDSQGKFIAESEKKELDLTKTDNIPPAESDQFTMESFKTIDSNKIRSKTSLFKDKTFNTEIGNNREFYPDNPVEFYFVPKYYGSDLTYETAKDKAISNYELTITTADKQNQYYEIPYDIAGVECYLYFRIIDNSDLQNEKFACAKHVRLPVLYTNIFDVSVSGNDFKISTESEQKITVSIKKLENDKWKDFQLLKAMTKDGQNSSLQTYTTEYNTIPQSFLKITYGYMRPLYVYPGYYEYLSTNSGSTSPAYCKSKSWMPMANGWQIFADRPAFVHTLYSSKNLTQTGNFTTAEAALEWETRAQETGLVYNDGTGITFSYTDENLAGIPEDYYYTTICHFADGSVLMSDVQQK